MEPRFDLAAADENRSYRVGKPVWGLTIILRKRSLSVCKQGDAAMYMERRLLWLPLSQEAIGEKGYTARLGIPSL